ncbi:hypothetical protein SFRURICE_016968 [Spodoptera frugiperda]|nr:hypothetical protein SFRURICE_016968 [Spodoptera frugiperda]
MFKLETYKRRNKVQICKNHNASDTLVPKDVQLMIRPLNLMQNIFCCPKYWIKDNTIMPIGYLSKLMSLSFTIICIICIIYRLYDRIKIDIVNNQGQISNLVTRMGSLVSTITGFLVNYWTTVVFTDNNVVLMLKFIAIHKFLNNEIAFRRFTISNWICVISFFSFEILFILYISSSFKLPLHNVVCGMLIISFDGNIVYATLIIKLLKDKVDLWNIKNYQLGAMDDRERKMYSKKIFDAYVNILDCYEQYCICFQQHIVFHCIYSFAEIVIYFQIGIQFNIKRSEYSFIVTSIVNVARVVKDMLLETFICLELEKFYINEERRLYKNIMRLYQTKFRKLNACGMFYVDAMLPFDIIKLTSHYCIKINKCEKKKQNYCMELLLSNFVDREIQFMLLPLNIMQNILGYPKYRILDNFITPNSRSIYVLSFCVALISVFMLFYRSYDRYLTGIIHSKLLVNYGFILFSDFFFPSSGIIVTFTSIFFHADSNIMFVLKIMNIHRLHSDKDVSKSLTIFSWIFVLFISIYHSIFILVINLHFKLPLYNLFCGFCVVIFDINMASAIMHIKLLKDKAVLWNVQITNVQSMEENKKMNYFKKVFQTYNDILDCYDIYRICFQQHILFNYVYTVCTNLIDIKNTLGGIKNRADFLPIVYRDFPSYFVWLSTRMSYGVVLSLEFQKFYDTVHAIRETCRLILISNCSEYEKRFYKNIDRLHRTRFDKMSVCRMFYLDAALPLNIFILITNYIVVLLQFANIFFCPKYRIRNNKITPNSCISILISSCFTLICIALISYRFYNQTNVFNDFPQYQFINNLFRGLYLVSLIAGFLINYWTSVFHGDGSIMFILKFITIHKFFNNEIAFKRFGICIWINVIMFFCFAISFILFISITFHYTLYHFICGFVVISFDCNMVYSTIIIKLLKDKVHLWNTKHGQFNDRDRTMCGKIIFQAYTNILDSYEHYCVSFQKQIAFHCIFSFIQIVIYFEAAIQYAKYTFEMKFFIIIIIVNMMSVIKNFILEALLSLQLEKFYITLSKTQDVCLLMLHSDCVEDERRLYKNIKRLYRTKFSKLNACRMFYVDAMLPFDIIMLTSNYCIVLLQFALL